MPRAEARMQYVCPFAFLFFSGSFFPFYRENMTFEEFVPAFGQWYAGNIPTACFVGIRAEESLNRWVSVAGSNFKRTYCHRRWTTRCSRVLCNAYPLYDWRTEDIWTYCGRYGMEYNHLYDRLFQAGLPLRMMRICGRSPSRAMISSNLVAMPKK